MIADSATRAAVTSPWLPFRGMTGPGPHTTSLYCLPHAGGGASGYRTWLGKLPGVAVLPLQPPGREGRYQEPALDRMASLVGALADVVLADLGPDPARRRYACYGHSLGAVVAFELARELRRRGAPPPAHLFVSGSIAPHTDINGEAPIATRPVAEVVAMLRDLGGTPDWLLADPSALEMILPAVRADFTIKETYRYAREPRLDVPITALASTEDPRARPRKVAKWGKQTSRGFTMHVLDGGHFAVFEQAALTHGHLLAALLGDDRGGDVQLAR